MKTFLSFIAVSLLISVQSYSQKAKIDWGKEVEAGKEASFNIPLGKKDGYLYNLRCDNKGSFAKINVTAYLEKYDQNLTRVSNVELKNGQKDFDFNFAYVLNELLHIVSIDYDKKTKRKNLNFSTYDESGKPVGKIITTALRIQFQKNRQNFPLNIELSNDSSLMMVTQEITLNQDENVEIYYAVLDASSYEVIRKDKIQLGYVAERINLQKSYVDNEGNCYFIVTIDDEKVKGTKKSHLSYSTHLIVVDKNGNIKTDKLITFGKYDISSLNTKINDKNELVLAGITFEKIKKTINLTGFYISKYNAEENILEDEKYLKFDNRLRAAYGKKVKKDGTISGVFQYKINVLEDAENGGGYLVAENRYETVESASNGRHMHKFNFDELLIVKYNPDNELEWIKMVPKEQIIVIGAIAYRIGPVLVNYFPEAFSHYSRKYNSYLGLVRNGNLYLMYNDHEKNLYVNNMKEVKAMANYKKAMAFLVEIEKDGEINKNYLFSAKGEGVFFSPVASFVNLDEVIIFAERKDRNRLGFLIIE